jgi:hypothetical protein
VNHVGHKAGIAGVYDRHDYAGAIKDALEKWATHLLAIVNRDNVTPMRKRA